MPLDSTLQLVDKSKLLPKVQGEEPRVPATGEGAAPGRSVW